MEGACEAAINLSTSDVGQASWLPRLQPCEHRAYRHHVGIFHLQIVKIGEVRTFVAIGRAFLRHDGAESVRETVHGGRPHATGRRPPVTMTVSIRWKFNSDGRWVS